MKNKFQEKQKSLKKIELPKSTISKLNKISKKYAEIFEDDKVLLHELRSEINAQQRKAS